MSIDEAMSEINEKLLDSYGTVLQILRANEAIARERLKGEALDRFITCQLELEAFLNPPGTVSEKDLLAELDFT